MYEVELRRENKVSEVQLSDRALTPGETLTVAGELWRVLRAVKAENARAEARYVCVPLLASPSAGLGSA